MTDFTASSQLPYAGERCDVCGNDAVRIVHYSGDTIALCRRCHPSKLYDK